jgi:hypothetical protein
MKIFEDIRKDIEELKNLVNSNDLVTKLQVTERLAINCYYLSSVVADNYEESSNAEYFYKSSLSSAIANSNEGVAKSEAKAKVEFTDLHKDWVTADSLYKRSVLLLNAANVVIEQARQSISYLKQELSATR